MGDGRNGGNAFQLSDEQESMLSGEFGKPVRWAIDQQIRAGQVLGARRLIPISSVLAGAEIGITGSAGLEIIEGLGCEGARVRVPSVTAACSVDFCRSKAFGVSDEQIEGEHRLHTAMRSMGFIDCSTCISYQTVSPPRFGEHLAWGDTGAVTFANSVVGARSNYEGGPAAIAASLTGLVPEYGFHLADARRGTHVYTVEPPLRGASDWGAVGALIGEDISDYWTVPVIVADRASPSVDELKHLSASLASFGSLGMFHLVGSTPEARDLGDACQGERPTATRTISEVDVASVYQRFAVVEAHVDLVVLSAPQLSMYEATDVIERLRGHTIASGTRLIMTVNHQVEAELTRLGFADALYASGGEILAGVCFYVMAPAVVRAHLQVRTLVTPSAKLANILGGAGYRPVLRSLEQCIDAALTGRLAR